MQFVPLLKKLHYPSLEISRYSSLKVHYETLVLFISFTCAFHLDMYRLYILEHNYYDTGFIDVVLISFIHNKKE